MLFIAGLIVNIAAPAVWQSNANNEKNAIRALFQKMRLANENAILFNHQYALVFDQQGDGTRYYWLRHEAQNETWRPYQSTEFSPGSFPQESQVELSIESQDVYLRESAEDSLANNDDQGFGGQADGVILFLSSGETTPFEMSVRQQSDDGAERVWHLASNHWGQISLRDQNDEEIDP